MTYLTGDKECQANLRSDGYGNYLEKFTTKWAENEINKANIDQMLFLSRQTQCGANDLFVLVESFQKNPTAKLFNLTWSRGKPLKNSIVEMNINDYFPLLRNLVERV
jgi:hypothetical protein